MDTETAPPRLSPGELSLFLDFDGTLVPIAERPDAVSVARQTIELVERLQALTGGAVAVVSGRPVETLERFLAPADLALSGSHGLELKLPGRPTARRPVDAAGLAEAVARLKRFAGGDNRLLIEEKPASVALHYRQAPERQEECERLVQDILHSRPDLNLMPGKMVLELKAGSGNKAGAIAELMALEPFRGRVPLFAGDDVTDEDAFGLVEELGGVTVRIGPGETSARYRLDDVAAFLAWLGELAAHPEGSAAPPSRIGAAS